MIVMMGMGMGMTRAGPAELADRVRELGRDEAPHRQLDGRG